MTDLLCPVCCKREPAPVCCVECAERITTDLRQIRVRHADLTAWQVIEGAGRLAMLDSPILTQSGKPDLHVIAVTDPRSKPVIDGWHTEPQECSCGRDCDLRQDTADSAFSVDGELLTLARMVVYERDLSAPLASMAEVIEVLLVNADWLATHDAVGEHAPILHSCAHALRVALKDTPERAVGRCPQPDPRGERDACGGPLRWQETAAWTSTGVEAAEVVCARCGDVTPGDARSLAGLLMVSGKAERVPVAKAWLVAEFGVTDVWLRKWIMKGEIRRYADGQVDLADVMRMMEVREARRA